MVKTIEVWSNVNLVSLPKKSETIAQYCLQTSQLHSVHQKISEGASNDIPDNIWLHLDINYPGIVTGSQSNLQSKLAELRSTLSQWIEFMGNWGDTQCLISNFHLAPSFDLELASIYERLHLQSELNQWLQEQVDGHPNCFIVRIDSLVETLGTIHTYDPRLWIIGRIPYSRPFMEALAEAALRAFAYRAKPLKKGLIVDLDNTLWGGILDEQDHQPIELGYDGLGLAFRQFQTAIKNLAARGVLLGIVSKNDPQKVQDHFKNNSTMVLKPEDFVAIKTGWKAKSAQIVEIASELDLSVESLVMLDDDPRERLEIAQNTPGVATPELPEDPAFFADWFLNHVVPEYFALAPTTESDKQRKTAYKQKLHREAIAKTSVDLDSFLKELGIKLTLTPITSKDLARVEQMIERTNQFNLNKSTRSVVAGLKHSPGRVAIKAHYEDKFGPEGIIGIIVGEQKGDSFYVQSFALSCRVLEKGVEHALLLESSKAMHGKTIVFELEASDKNKRLQSFLRELSEVAERPIAFDEPTIAYLKTKTNHIELTN